MLSTFFTALSITALVVIGIATVIFLIKEWDKE